MIVLKILGITMAVLLAVILVILLFPVTVIVFTDEWGKIKVHCRILWFVFGKKSNMGGGSSGFFTKLLAMDRISDVEQIRKTARSSGVGAVVRPALAVIRHLLERVQWLLGKCRIRRLRAHIAVAHDDAAMAAIEYGSVSTALYSLAGWIDSRMKLDKGAVDVAVSCDFSRTQTVVDMNISVSVRMFWCVVALIWFVIQNYRDGLYKKNP